MSYPKIDIDERKIILLSGFEPKQTNERPFDIRSKDELEKAVSLHRDAVAFGYVSGKWVPAA